MDRVLVTGGNGFIGKALVRELVRQGVEVVVVGRNHYPELTALGVQCHKGDIRDPECMVRVTARCDIVFHVAAKAGIWGDRDEYHAINVDGTANVIAACRTNGVRGLVHTSTPSVVFDRCSIEGTDETIPYATRTLCHYAASKIEAEKLVLQANSSQLRTSAIRPHLVWGPGDNHLIPRLLDRGRKKSLKIVGSGENYVDIAYIDNVVHVHVLAARDLVGQGDGAGQAFFVGQDQPVRLWHWINDLFVRLNIPPVRRKVPFAVAYAVGAGLEAWYSMARLAQEPQMTRFLAHQLAHSHWFSHERACRVLGYRQLVSTEDGLNRLIAWLQSGQTEKVDENLNP
ncbi:NAD-dependent epimerase/dehydratase family protein [Desulfobulbus alkaliphilus]|uniref:NAD-dependent epimerase/dehydratase family protein n=1 Tax=Desulfobulbus alkaliphilus TaxID=869814 RepID=UPI0019665668|nr:NAD-dependent epimerase/dehydratase family protein [Desulfobulbus alkaliphilus]MBM9537255.1 NAD-dependent epimerase/dehydratase family protein [Desulfobulbus alkaliphilus]